MLADVRYALRVFARQPVIYATATAGLTLAIAVSTSVFTVVNSAVLRASGVRAPHDVLALSLHSALFPRDTYGGVEGAWSHRDAVALRSGVPQGDVIAVSQSSHPVSADEADQSTAPSARIDAVSGNYFSSLGGRAFMGRLLAPDDDRPGAPGVTVLSHTFWLRMVDARRDIVGRTVRIAGVPFQVVGVVAPDFRGPTGMYWQVAGAWIPVETSRPIYEQTVVRRAVEERRRLADLSSRATLAPPEREALRTLQAQQSREPLAWNPVVQLFARPRAGVTAARLVETLSKASIDLASARGQTLPTAAVAVKATTLEDRDARQFTTFILGLGIGAGLIVVLACANVANALLAATTARRRELAVRRAIGASRWRMFRQTLIESSLIGLGGGACGYLLSYWIAPVLGAWHTPDPLVAFAPDRVVFLFAAAACLIVSLLAGLAPTRQAHRVDVLSALKADAPAAPGIRGGLRSLLIGVQSAVSIVLLLSAALLGRSLHHAATLDVGIDLDRLMNVSTGLRGYDEPRAAQYWDAALARVREVPGVESASLSSAPGFGGGIGLERWVDGRVGRVVTAGDGFLETLGLRLLRGRSLTRDDVQTGAAVAVISETVGRWYWDDADPVGDSLDRVRGARRAELIGRAEPRDIRVIGVVSDSVSHLDSSDAPAIYRPLPGVLFQNYQLAVRTTADSSLTAPAVVSVLRSIDPEQSPSVTLLRDAWRRQLEGPTRLALLAAVVGVAAIVLAVIGLVGVTAFVAGVRRHELSVRSALGATRGSLLTLLCRDSLKPVLAGLVFGLIPAFWSAKVLERQLLGISVRDPAAVTVAVVLLVAAATAAAFVPARRAAKANPADLLRET